MNTLVGQNIEQNYSIDSNGTLSVQDNYGDNFSLYVIGYSSAGTSTTTTFLGNSTYIVANHLTMNGLQQVSNVSISFIVHKQFCNPSGMEVVIQGNSATTSNNTISFQFKERPTSFGQSVVWFDNGQLNPVIAPNAQNNSSTGTSATSPAHLASLGFSWADSANLNPVFNNATETLTYQVSSQNFTIDPIVVGGSSYPYATSNDYGGHTCEAAGRYWVFYVNATNSPVYQSSTDGSVWSTPTSFGSSGIAGNIQGGFSVYCSGANVYYAGSSDSSLTYSFIIGQGSMGSNGAVTWSHAPYTLSTPNAGVSDPSITADSNGNVWAAVTEVYPSTRLDVYKCTSSESGCTYSNSLTGNAAYPPELVPLTNGKMALLFGGSGIVVDEYSGTSWSSGPTTSHSVSLYYSSAVAIGDTIELGASDGTNVYYYIFAYGGSSWSSGVTVGQGHYAGISGDDNNRLVVSYISGSSVEYVYSTASGLYWSDPVIVSSSETSPEFISASFAIDSGMFQAAWTDTGTSNYDVKFVSLPSVIPNAATSGKPWSKPGLSPFQDYFTHISEYVSPGNGLLGISQTDYSLTGRNGLDLAITRVYSTPYSFSTGNKTFNYDNFTLSNLGAGWSLDFPWLGQYFVHVGEGQAYAYNWTGSVFLNTRGQPFKLSNNSGSSFDLYLASGVDYHFDSLKRLVSITDTTGNNTLTLEYNSNSYISNITDSVGRIIKFIYSGSTSQLSTIITGEGNFTYAYSGSDLVSVTDPMNHVTKYYYKTGLNSWLVSSITYPTGAYTNYTYAGAPVGTGVMTYYATSQSVYISSGNLDRSTQYNYDITNGQINSCNTTVADGSGTNQSRINYVFSGTSSKQTQVQEYANKTIILQYESDFDATGRINESKTLSPTNTVLAYSVTHYDNWSNVVFTQNEIGQKTWYSYANTNTTNTFTDGASGFTNSFYANNTVISSNIHDLLVGEAQYQNGQGTNKSETYYNYNSAGELIHQKQLHNGSWLVSSYTYDHYGNKLTATDPLGRTTYYQYSSTYDYAYPTQQSIIVSGDVQGNGGASGSISLDGSASARCVNVVTCSTSLSTSKSPDVIVVTAVDQASDTINTPTDTAGLTWTLRKSVVNGGLHSYYWYAIATGSLSSDSISVTASASCVIALTAFGISGANTASPFDSNSGLPASATGSSTSPSVTISTSNANDMLLGIPAAVGSATVSAGTGFTQIKTSTSPGTGDEYEIVSALQSSSSVGSTLSASENWAMIGDAIVQASSASGGSQNVSTTYTYNFTTGLQLSVTDPNGHTTNYAYDKIGRLTATIYPLVNQVASETKYFYNDAGNYMTTTDPNGNNVTNYFDGLERSVRVVTYNGSSVYSTQNYTYNYLDLKSSYTTANGNTTQYSYDALGFQTKVTNPDGTSSTASYNYQNNTVTATDEDGHKTIYAYDWTKKDLLWVREYNSSSSYYLTTYSYDLSANLLSVTDAKNQKTTYQYDDLNRLIVTKYPDGTNQTVTYDSVGNVISRLDPAGHTITYAYDQLNMLSNVTYPNAAKVLYTYDLAGNTLSVSGNAQSATSSSSTTFIYDARNRVTSETDKIGGTSYTTSYYYDKASNVVAMNYPDSYNLTYSYDFLNRVVNVGSSGSVASFKYTVDSKISSISYYNGVVTTYSYDKRDRPTLILSKKGTTTLQSLSYAYDAVGNVISVNSPSYNYTYDNLNRLNYTSGPWGKITYAYDAVGNRVKMVYGSVTTTYLYSSYNRLTQENTSSWTATLTYDKNGNLKKIVNGSTSWNYYYDYENHLTGVSKNGANVQNSTYDAQGRRIEQNVSGATVAYVYQGSNNIIYEKNLSSGVVTKHYYADGMQVGELSGSTSYYLQQDSIGSTRLATTSTGAIQFSSDYLPFGPEYNPSGSGIYFLFTGKLIDPVTGLYYFGARYYDPESGRFISEDTNPGDVKDPMSENRYIYARDNPLSLVDPTGHMFILPALNYQVYVPPSTQSCGYFGCGTGTQVYGPPQPPTTVTTPGVSSVDSCSFSSAGCQSTSTNLPSHTMDYYQWLDTVFLPQHLGEIVTDSIAVVIAFLGPIALAYLGGSNGVMEAVAASISSELALDEANLANDLNSGNVGGLVAEIGNIAGTAAVSLLHTLSPIELMGLAVAETGLSIGTGGLIDAVDWLAGTAALATTLTGLWEESITDFNNQN